MKARRRIATAAVMAAVAAFPTAASAGDQLWWSNYGAGIPRVDLGTGTGANVFSGAPGVSGPYGTAADPANGKIYWINYGNRKIYSGQIDGSGTPQLVTSSNIVNPYGLASDPKRGQLFWLGGASAPARQIQRINMDGTGATGLFTDSVNVISPVVDPGAGRIYWNRITNPRTIGYGSVDGDGSIGTIEVPASCPYHASTSLDVLAVDSENGVVYLGTSGNPSTGANTGIARMNLDGTNCTAVAATSQTPSGMALDTDAKRLYWTDYINQQLRFVNLDPLGSQQTVSQTGATVSSPAYPVLIKAPAGTASVTPTSADPGATLTCTASWSVGAVGASMYRSPQSTSYAWRRDGQTVSGATGTTLTADSAGSYECLATGTNAAGATTVTSPAATVQAAPSPEPGPTPIPPIPPLPPLPPIPTPPNSFTVKSSTSTGSSLRTRVTVPGPGVLSQRGTRAAGARTSASTSACTGTRDIAAAGTYTITCRTSAATRRAQQRGKVRIVLTTSFTPTGGVTASGSRIVTLPALKPRYTG